MIDYTKIVAEICNNTDVKKDEVFFYNGTSLEKECNSIFQFGQSYLDNEKGLGFFKIAPARIFINSEESVNAWAWVNKGYSLISINIGTIRKLKALFLDKENLFIPDGKFSEYENLERLFKKLGSSILETMYHCAIMFLIYHECAHLIQDSKKVHDVINEEVSNQNEFEIYDHEVEIDSDIFASVNLGKHTIDIWNQLGQTYRTKENLIKIISVIVSGVGVYRLFYLQLGNKKVYFEENSHPHVIIRCIVIIEILIDYALYEVKQLDNSNMKQLIFDEVANPSFDLIENLTKELFEDEVFNDFVNTASANFKEINEYAQKLVSLVRNDENMADSKWKKLLKKDQA